MFLAENRRFEASDCDSGLVEQVDFMCACAAGLTPWYSHSTATQRTHSKVDKDCGKRGGATFWNEVCRGLPAGPPRPIRMVAFSEGGDVITLHIKVSLTIPTAAIKRV